jgi:ribosome-associated translation inhibitor RaiA
MEEQTKKTEIGRLSLRSGLLIGGVSVILAIVFRIVDPLMQFTNMWVQILSTIITIALLVILAIDIRKKIGGFWRFGEAFKSLIIMSFITMILTILYGFILFKFIDPDMPAKINDASQAVIEQRLSKMGISQDKIDEVSKTFESGEFKAKLEPTLKNEVTSLGFGLIIYAVIDLIIAACVKKQKPYNSLENAIDPTE